MHGWDVVASLGVPAPFDDETLAAVLPYAEEVPDGQNRREPGASFRPGLPAPDAGPLLDRILATLGRSPKWSVQAAN